MVQHWTEFGVPIILPHGRGLNFEEWNYLKRNLSEETEERFKGYAVAYVDSPGARRIVLLEEIVR